jgi:hypothetical protein
MLSIEERLLPLLSSGNSSVAGARVELGGLGVGGVGHGDCSASIPERNRKAQADPIHRKHAVVDARKTRLADDREDRHPALPVHLGLLAHRIPLTLEGLDFPACIRTGVHRVGFQESRVRLRLRGKLGTDRGLQETLGGNSLCRGIRRDELGLELLVARGVQLGPRTIPVLDPRGDPLPLRLGLLCGGHRKAVHQVGLRPI